MPLATVVGLCVAVWMMFLDPERRWGVAYVQKRLRRAGPEGVARLGALALLAPGAMLAWVVVSAHAARAVLLRNPEPWTAGAAMAATSVFALTASSVTVLALVPATARTVTTRVAPW